MQAAPNLEDKSLADADTKRQVAVVVGAGPGNGQALAERFAADGYAVALLARNQDHVVRLAERIPNARGYACDIGDDKAVSATFSRIRKDIGDVDVLLYNAGSGVFADIEEVTAAQFEAAWRVNALGALLCSQQVIPAMKARRKGDIVFVGATASRRGNIKTAAFAPAKAAQRSLAESMARKLWPFGIHVAVIILDGVVDSPRVREMMPERPVEGFVSPAALAQTARNLTLQDRRGWSFEVEVRPFLESW
jgi:NAD(P)-dependent dehydrogenase (short-subunit alcohol dehydrogenase family)